MKVIINYTLIIFLALLSSCQPENQRCFKSNGVLSEEIILLDSFNEIVVEDFVYVELKQDTVYKIVLSGGKNLLPFIKYELNDGKLFLNDENSCRWLRQNDAPLITVSFPDIDKLTITNSGVITCSNTINLDNFSVENRAGLCDINIRVNCDSIWFRTHAGTGDFVLSGEADYSYIYNIGSGHMRAQALINNTTHIVHRSTGDITINVSSLLMVEDLQHGILYYYGCPEMIVAAEHLQQNMHNMGYY